MKFFGRILVTAAITLAVIFVGVTWVAPVALSYYAVWKAPPVARIVPADLKDQAVSLAPGQRLSYVGYEFEVPWDDLDQSQTKLYPTAQPEKTRVDLHFRSGVRLLVTALPPRELVDGLPATLHWSSPAIEAVFGHEAMKSDCNFDTTLYEFTPDKMNHWGSQRDLSRDEFFLMIKSLALSKAAESGIFRLHASKFNGFQQGNPEARPGLLVVSLYADDGGIEFLFSQKGAGITQPEINRIVQSLRRTTQGGPAPMRAVE